MLRTGFAPPDSDAPAARTTARVCRDPPRDSQLLFDNPYHLGTGVMFPEFMLYNLEMERDERVVEIKVRPPLPP